jgi:hypothetical protein
MAGEKTRVTVEVLLECGCWVEKTLASTGGIGAIGKTLQLVTDMLPHHLDRVEVAHKCDLVTEDNPNGDSRGN